MSSIPDIKAKAIPEDITSPEALTKWISDPKLPVGSISQIPESWRSHLTKNGIITRVPRDTLLLLSTEAKTAPLTLPIKKGTMVFFAPHTA